MHLMNRIVATCVCSTFGITIAGCGGEDDHAHEPGDSHVHADGDDHDHDDEGVGGTADDGDHGHGHGGAQRLPGTVIIEGTVLEVTIEGALEPNGELHVEIERVEGPLPAAIRLWIGDASASGSVKVKADGHDDHFHAHAQAPATITNATAMWIEVETMEGARSAVSLALH